MPSFGASEPDRWRRSSFCGAGECVEVARLDGSVLIRDSKDPSAGALSYTVDEFRALVQGIQAGEFDDLCAL
jgi:Domain of unknown function (DUF397)